jgi:hypothetical protein
MLLKVQAASNIVSSLIYFDNKRLYHKYLQSENLLNF